MFFMSRNKTDFPQSRLLQVNSCGSEKVTSTDYTIYRPYGRNDFHFLYLKNGWLDAEIGDNKVTLHAGDCAVFYPNIRQKYTFSKEGNPISLFLHFTGMAASEAMTYIQPNELNVYTISEKSLFESLFIKLNRIHNLQTPSFISEENSILLQLITIIAKESNKNTITTHEKIANAMEYLSLHMSEKIDLETYAKKIDLSYSRFVHLFTETTGIPPHQYLLKLRLEHATYLLKYSTMKISDIAASVGFDDNYYFSRIFKKKYNLSPKDYRNQNKTQ